MQDTDKWGAPLISYDEMQTIAEKMRKSNDKKNSKSATKDAQKE
jgi:hypothetical protein